MAANIFLKLEGIEGESADSKHRNEIEIESFSWGMTSPGSAAANSPGKAVFQDLTVTKFVDKASVRMALLAGQGKHVKEAILVVRKPGENPIEYLRYKLGDVL